MWHDGGMFVHASNTNLCSLVVCACVCVRARVCMFFNTCVCVAAGQKLGWCCVFGCVSARVCV